MMGLYQREDFVKTLNDVHLALDQGLPQPALAVDEL
jgi:hypothetical protein